ncbi:MAG: hypothetical protein IKZ44_05360 [Clostridia bacterium]|nr:hypothetical protein [Clostridia bacterium]
MRTVKRIVICVLALGMALSLACRKTDGELHDEIAGKTFVRENGGFGGDFTITLDTDDSYRYYEGYLSSYVGFGDWTVEDGTAILTEQGGHHSVYRFAVKDGALIYLADGSDNFLYVNTADGDRFLPEDAN